MYVFMLSMQGWPAHNPARSSHNKQPIYGVQLHECACFSCEIKTYFYLRWCIAANDRLMEVKKHFEYWYFHDSANRYKTSLTYIPARHLGYALLGRPISILIG